jgi:ATP-dependent helicase/DNAse subunit B
VTEFRDYLASPYRYYLRHILKLSTSGDQIEELDGATFGVLVHEVLKQFGNSPFRESTYGPEIADYLSQTLDQVVHASFGPAPLATVQIQFEQARRRLLAFAGWQSQWRLQGWEIHSVECSPPEPVPFSLGDGRTVSLVGRIDRIDYHPREKRWALLDYKTGDAGASPEKTHRDQDDWIDLQLPLYRHLVRHLTDSTDLQLGYLVLPRQANEVDSKFAEWNADDLAEADEVARKIIRRVQEEDFWVELPEPVTTLLEFDPICQAGVFGQEAVV